MRPFDSSETKESPIVAGDRHGVPDIDEQSRDQSEGKATEEKVERDAVEENGIQ